MSNKNEAAVPPLPDKHHFRVVPNRRWPGTVDVMVCKRGRIFDSCIDEVCGAYPSRNGIRSAMETLSNRIKNKQYLDSLCGNYPPKSL